MELSLGPLCLQCLYIRDGGAELLGSQHPVYHRYLPVAHFSLFSVWRCHSVSATADQDETKPSFSHPFYGINKLFQEDMAVLFT